jgi:hypothetical protein
MQEQVQHRALHQRILQGLRGKKHMMTMLFSISDKFKIALFSKTLSSEAGTT